MEKRNKTVDPSFKPICFVMGPRTFPKLPFPITLSKSNASMVNGVFAYKKQTSLFVSELFQRSLDVEFNRSWHIGNDVSLHYLAYRRLGHGLFLYRLGEGTIRLAFVRPSEAQA